MLVCEAHLSLSAAKLPAVRFEKLKGAVSDTDTALKTMSNRHLTDKMRLPRLRLAAD